MSKHSGWLVGVVTSTGKITNNEVPLVKSLHPREESQRTREMNATKEQSLKASRKGLYPKGIPQTHSHSISLAKLYVQLLMNKLC
jgi:hypothetical protein